MLLGSVAELDTNSVPKELLIEEGERVTSLGINPDANFRSNHGIAVRTCWCKIREPLSLPCWATPSPCMPAACVVVAWQEPCVIYWASRES